MHGRLCRDHCGVFTSNLRLAKQVVTVLENLDMKFEIKLCEVSRSLGCTPTIPGIGEALSRLALWSYNGCDDVQPSPGRYQCRLCNFGASGHKVLLEHLVDDHSGGPDDGCVVVEYRKKVFALVADLGLSREGNLFSAGNCEI